MMLPRHFYSLDALRGLAALSVVFWHWQHFFFDGASLPPGFVASCQPFYRVFRPFYDDGGKAVILFFSISGFIFYWLYGESIGAGRTSLSRFSLLRFSRLYPLHLVTLLLVAAGQALYFSWHSTFFVYQWNDEYHFFLQLFFASNWGLERGFSFNAPIWSVSIEVLLYAAFFLTCRLGLHRWWHLALFVAATELVASQHYHLFFIGLTSFFMGGLAFYAAAGLARRGVGPLVLGALVAATALGWISIPWALSHNFPARAYHAAFPADDPEIFGIPLLSAMSTRAYEWAYTLGLFPLTLTTLALIEARRGSLGARFAWLGQLSYSAYLLHFPLQMAFVLIASRLGAGSSFYQSPVSLLLFFAVLVPLSLASYQFLERPAQSWLRLLLDRPKKVRELGNLLDSVELIPATARGGGRS